MTITPQDLSAMLANNPSLRIAGENGPYSLQKQSGPRSGTVHPSGQNSPQAQAAGLQEPIFFVVPGCPIPKPRQSQRDKWAKRPCVLRYRDWADKARKALKSACGVPRLETAGVVHVSAYLPMPLSWSAKKRAEMRGLPHRQKPDADNLLKSAIDSCIRKDETVYRKEIYKEWAIEGQERTEIYIH